jgi:hypothetical protein
MPADVTNPMLAPFLAAAETVAQARPEVDVELARELLGEAATLLHNGLALDGLDDHDTAAVVAALSRDLVARDPGVAVRARAEATLTQPGDLHDAEAAWAAYLNAAAILQL